MEERYSIGEFSKRTATTIRTLRYYDEMNLLKPSHVTEKGRRYYTNNDFITLQKILSLKFLGYSLEQIKEFFQKQTWNLKETLSFQKKEMVHKKEQIENVIKALDHAIHVIEDHHEIDPSIFISLIQSIQMDKEQKEWLKSYLGEELVENIYAVPEKKQLEVDKKWIDISVELKSLSEMEPDHDRVQELIREMMVLIKELTGDENEIDFIMRVSEKGLDLEEDSWLVYSPFSINEENWLAEAVEIYLKRKGVILEDEDGTKSTS